jgi:hypothetical protein
MIKPEKISHKFTSKDFDRAFAFAVEYYLSKTLHSGRTSGEPRGLGAVLDAFTRGKLAEIAVQKMLENINTKKIILDFDIKSIGEVAEEPDIITVAEDGAERTPNLFIEIKNTSVEDRWIGLTEEQLKTMMNGSRGKKIFNIYSSLHVSPINDISSTADLVGMYLKYISNHPVFSFFADLNAEAHLEFILSADDLKKYGVKFPMGEKLYETNMFTELTSGIWKKDGRIRANISLFQTINDFSGHIPVPLIDGKNDNKYGNFNISGSFDWYRKVNPKSQRDYIHCKNDTLISSDVFGNFYLKKNNTYNFNLITLGRDPILKRNNLWIAKRRVYQLIQDGKIMNPNTALQDVAHQI